MHLAPPDDVPAMRAALERLADSEDLPTDAVTAVFRELMAGRCDPVQIGALLMGLAQKGESLGEIVGAARAMRETMDPVRSQRAPLLDTCGTGGSGLARRNVSTAVALAVAACGVAVAKHGNRAATSRSGSADVLEVLGVRLDASPAAVARTIDEVGIGFLFAPVLHPAMQHAMGPRRALGIPTIFNLLGPLTNPAGATRQLLGVFDPRRCEALAGALGALGSERVLVVHGFRQGISAAPESAWGIDDMSIEGESWVAQWYRGRVETRVLRPEMAGLSAAPLCELAGEGPVENAEALLRLLEGEPGAYRVAVQWSGALALLAAGEGTFDQLPAFAAQIADVLDNGRARSTLADLVAFEP
jgi:anthranilate phosphoribosyltransferase